jgi:hypothetical protein
MSKLPLHKFTVVSYKSANAVPTREEIQATDRTSALEKVRPVLDRVLTGELQRVFVRQETPTMCYIADQRFTPTS